MRNSQILKKFLQQAVLPVVLLMYCLTAWADANDPILPGPKTRGASEGLGVGSLISSAVLSTPKNSDGSGGDVVVWGYRKNGHSGNYNWNGKNVGFEHNSATARKNYPRFESVKDLKDPNHPLYDQKIVRLFTTAHTFYLLTEEGELWAWGDSVNGTAGCIETGYETGVDSSNRFTDYAIVYNTYKVYRNGSLVSKKASHYQARPCPAFSSNHPNPELRRKVVYIDGGEYNAIAITEDGRVFTWGNSSFDQTVKGGVYSVQGRTIRVPTGDKGEPVDITDFFVDDDGDLETVILVGGAYENQYALTVDKKGKYTLWGWGRNFRRGIDNSTGNQVSTPKRMPQYDAIANKIIYVNGGYAWTAVLLDNGDVWCSGAKGSCGMNGGKAPEYGDTYPPIKLMGEGTAYPTVTKLIVRYNGGVAVPKDDPTGLYHWGFGEGSAYKQVYGSTPTRSQLAGDLKSVGATKEAIFYMTEDSNLYGVGYGDQRVINVCDNNTVSYDRARAKYVDKNSMNWYRAPGIPGGYRIPYEDLIDVTGQDYCDGTFSSGYYSGKTRSSVRKWTGYDDGRDGPVPSDSGALLCQDAGTC